MKQWQLLFGLVLALLFIKPLSAQVPPEKSESTFTVSDGLEMKLWAAEPLLVNPTSIDVDHLGRVWVAEAVNYRRVNFGRPILRPEGDRIVILEDSKLTGKADKATVFYQGKELYGPMGIAVAKDTSGPGWKVYVGQSPDILVFEDKDGDGKADGPPKKLLSGFNGFDHDHGVHGLTIGPDGRLYFSVGDQGVKNLQSSDGKGKKWNSNSTDCRAGTIWRCDLDGKNLELIAHNFRNEYKPCVDSFGTVFVSDNDDDGNQQTRICYVMPGGNYGYHPRGPGESHWHEEQPGVVPKILRTYFGSPTGMCVYEGTLLPKKYWGQLLHTDAGPRHVRCYRLIPDGAGYGAEREDMVTSTDSWFRPSDIVVAPDGSVMVADWYDPGVGGHGMGDWTRGRIFRLAPKGNKPAVPKVDLEAGILDALASPALSVRYMAIARLRELMKADDKDSGKAMKVLRSALENAAIPELRARALRLMTTNKSSDALSDAFRDSDPRFRVLAYRLAKEANLTHTWTEAMPFVARDRSPAVRREVLLLLRDIDPAKVRPTILELAKRYDGKDRFYLAAIGIAVGQDQARRDIILANFDQEFSGWNEKAASLIWELRPPQVLPRLGRYLGDSDIPAAQRARIVDIIAASGGTDGGKTLIKFLESDMPPEVLERVLANLKQFLPGKWRELRGSAEVTAATDRLLSKPEMVVTGLALAAAAGNTGSVGKIIDIARDNKRAAGSRTAAIQTLGVIQSLDSINALESLLKSCPAESRIDVVQALGQQAENQTRRSDFNPALKVLQAVVMAGGSEQAVRQAAVIAVASCRSGSIWLLDQQAQNKLPTEFKDDVARLLRNSPYQDLRNKAMVAFPPPGRMDPKKLPSPSALALRTGDLNRGKQLMAASVKSDIQCLKCHTIRGVGGSVGPDLSVIGKKASRENLFESILLPSKAIADQYVSWVIETKKGLIVTGLLVEETPDFVTLRDANAKDTRFEKKDIESRVKSPVSIMPSDLLAYMTEDDLADVVEYLFAQKTPSLSLDYWHIIGPFDNGSGDEGIHKLFPPEKGIDLKASVPGKSGNVVWRTVKPDPQGYIDLQAFFAPASDNIVSYVYREIESPADQNAEIVLGSDDCSKLWVNETLVHTSLQHRAAAPEQDRVAIKLKKGINKILLKINNGDGAHGFYLTILAEQEMKRLP